MNGLIIASYVLKTQQQAETRNGDYIARYEQAHRRARRTLVSLAASFATLAAFAFVADLLK
jgi:hypothetical protein